MPSFKDNFSKQSDIYVKLRPHYPRELYAYLSTLTKANELVWDCGTGNGQAAIGLAEFYDKVIATDPSERQIKNALHNDRVHYKVETAEHNTVETNSVDLLAIANALHWFDFDTFYKETRRVLKNDGIIAAWSYGVPSTTPEVDEIIKHFHDHTLGDYWLAENRLVEKEYATVPFPFQQISSPDFFYEKTMNLNDIVSYINTWSALQRFIDDNKVNPSEQLLNDLRAVWGDDDSEKTVTWKLVLKVGRV